jgi:hypothetical protein
LLHGLQPVDEECGAKVTTEKSENVNFKPKDDDGTHLEYRSPAKTRNSRLATPALPTRSSFQLGTPVPIQD